MGALDQTPPAPAAASQRLMVLMFTDLVNSTAIKEQIGNQAYAQLLNRHDAFIRQALDIARGGRVLQDTGDGYFISFDSVAQAVSAALVFQWLMTAEAWPLPFASRVGLHLGEVDQHTNAFDEREKLVGSAIDLASRVMSLARGGQILLTRAVFDAARQIVREHPVPAAMTPAPPLQWMAHGPYMFKGAAEPVDVFEVGAEGTAPLAPPPDTDKAKRHIRPGDEATLGWRPALGRSLESTTNWILVEKLGEGGFGEVWLAEQVKTANKRVFKFCFDPDRLRALKREVVLFRLLRKALGDRRDIAAVKEWQFERAPYFIELDYTPEGNLTQWAEKQGGIGKVPLRERVAFAGEIAAALAAAHSVGILHKDTKPSNILVARDHGGAPYPRLTDFGIGILTDRSRLADFDISANDFTSTNITMNESSRTGTRMYAPPELLMGRPFTTAGDVYALGVVLYQMVVGDLRRPLAQGWEREVDDEILREDIAACVEGVVEKRLGSARELSERLLTLEERRTERERQKNEAIEKEALERRERKRRLLLRASFSSAMVLMIVLGVVGWLWRRARVGESEANKQTGIARSSESHAIAQAERARLAELRARLMLADTMIREGTKLIQKGDHSLALLYIAKAIELSAGDSEAERNYRIMFGQALAQAPRLCTEAVQVASPPHRRWFSEGRVIKLEGNRAIVADAKSNQGLSASMEHAGRVTIAAFSADGKAVVTASMDKTARVWDAATGKAITPPLEHGDAVMWGAFSPDGKQVATASKDKTARVWDAASGKALTPPMDHGDAVTFASFSDDGRRLVTMSNDRKTRVWDAQSGKLAAPLIVNDDGTGYAVFSHNGARLVTVGNGRTARVWNALTGKAITPYLEHTGLAGSYHGIPIQSASFTSDGRFLITESNDETRRVWAVGAELSSIPAMEHHHGLVAASFSFDGRRVVTASYDQSARVWDALTGKAVTEPMRCGNILFDAEFSADGRFVVTASADNSAQVWDAASGKQLGMPMVHKGPVLHACFSPDGKQVATASGDRTARVWETATGKAITPPLENSGLVTGVIFSSDGKKVLTAGNEGGARIWDAETGKSLVPPMGEKEGVYAASFSPDGTRIVTANIGKMARVWDAATGQPLTPPLEHGAAVMCASFSGDGRRVVTASQDMTARVWDAASGAPLTPPLQHAGIIRYAQFSPDGRMVVTASDDRTARVWDAATGKPITPALEHDGAVWHAAFSPDGLRVVTCDERAARIWSILPDERPAEDLMRLAELNSAQEFYETGSLVPLSAAKWQQRWEELTRKYPKEFESPKLWPVRSASLTTRQSNSREGFFSFYFAT